MWGGEILNTLTLVFIKTILNDAHTFGGTVRAPKAGKTFTRNAQNSDKKAI